MSDRGRDSRRHRDSRPWMALDETLQPCHDGFQVPEERPQDGAGSLSAASRRGFLKALGLSAASLAACERLPVNRAMPYLIPPEAITPGVPVMYATTCSACPASCGLLAKVLDGRPVKLEGNPEHPISRGGLCALGQADLRSLYDPGRLRGPSVDGDSATWQQIDNRVRQRLEAVDREGLGVYVLAPPIVSPSARAAVQAFLEPYGGTLVEYEFDPQRPSAALVAARMLTGETHLPSLRLQSVDLLVSFGADLFGTGRDPVGATASWADRRRAGEQRGAPRHVQVEGSLSLTGANADERWLATSSEREAMALWLLRAVSERLRVTGAGQIREALAGVGATPPHAERLAGLTEDLIAAPGRSLLVTASDRTSEQLAIALLNRLLGNDGNTLDSSQPDLTARSLDSGLQAFRQELAAGSVGAVFIVGLDMVGRLPDGPALAAALVDLPLAAGIFRRPTATAAACQVVAAANHPLECWGDAEPLRGLKTLAQPAIRPLFDTRDPWSNFLAWAGEDDPDWRFYVRDQWTSTAALAGGGSRQWWNEIVRTAGLATLVPHGGSADHAAAQTVAEPTARPRSESSNALDPAGSPAAPSSEVLAVLEAAGASSEIMAVLAAGGSSGSVELEVELITEVSCRSGDHAANPWLRELPDPLTRTAWTPCARIAPARARNAGIRDGDIVQVTVGEAAIQLPAVILPGQHPDVIAVPVGYDAWTPPSAADPLPAAGAIEAAAVLLGYAPSSEGALQWRGRVASLSSTGIQSRLPQVQVHAHTEGRPIIHQVSRYDEPVHAPHHPDADLWPPGRHSSPHWEMTIDLNLCVGCGGCVIACQAENNIPVVGPDQIARHRDMHWLRIDRYFRGDPDDPEVLFEPMLCSQCDHAPCETVCPVAATVHGEDGLNEQIYNRCVGTRYCANNCPYKVRRFNWYDFQPTDAVERMVLNPDVVVRSRGIMEKCTFCVQRIQAQRISSRRDGRPTFEIQTACQQSCPAQAIQFGDGADAQTTVAREREKPRAFQVLAELGVRPSLSYLARVRNRQRQEGDTGHSDGDAGSASPGNSGGRAGSGRSGNDNHGGGA